MGCPIVAPMFHDPEDVGKVRRCDCAGYGECLAQAERRGWPGFACGAAECYQPLDPEQRLQDAAGLMRFLDWVRTAKAPSADRRPRQDLRVGLEHDRVERDAEPLHEEGALSRGTGEAGEPQRAADEEAVLGGHDQVIGGSGEKVA